MIDRIGGTQDALDCAARMAKLKSYGIREYPEPENFLDMLLNNYVQTIKAKAIREDMGEQGAKWYTDLKKYQSLTGVPQTRLPFEFTLVP